MKSCEIFLPYFKQGDDLAHCLTQAGSVSEAFGNHSDQMQYAAAILLDIKNMIDKFPGETTVDACTHHISLTGSDELVDALVAAELATIPDWYDEEDEDFEDAEDEDFEDEGDE